MRKSRSSLLTTSGCSPCGKCLQLWIGATERLSAISLQIAFMSNKRPTASKSRPHSERTGQRISVRRLQDPARRDRNSANHVQGQRSAPLLCPFVRVFCRTWKLKSAKICKSLRSRNRLRHSMIANCFSGQVNYKFNRPLAFGSELQDLGRQELRPGQWRHPVV
jgi:hypothetical protein